jgi:hypothetical protein
MPVQKAHGKRSVSHKPANDQDILAEKLAHLESEHRDLDDVIRRIEQEGPHDRLQMLRLKKRKLQLKDQISWIEKQLVPDIIA